MLWLLEVIPTCVKHPFKLPLFPPSFSWRTMCARINAWWSTGGSDAHTTAADCEKQILLCHLLQSMTYTVDGNQKWIRYGYTSHNTYRKPQKGSFLETSAPILCHLEDMIMMINLSSKLVTTAFTIVCYQHRHNSQVSWSSFISIHWGDLNIEQSTTTVQISII